MKFVVTGGAGFIGSHLVENLLNHNHEVIIIDDFSSGLESNIPKNNLIHMVKSKLQDISYSDFGKDIDGIFHLAAQTSVPYSIDHFYSSSANNLLTTIKSFDMTRKLNIPIVYASSSAIYGNLPLGQDETIKYDILSPYAQDKLTMEGYAALCFDIYNTSSIGLRLFNVYGPRQDPTNPYSGVISIFIDRLLKNKPIIVNGGYQTRDFVFVGDIVKVMIDSMEYLFLNRSCQIFNVGTGISVTIDHLLAKLADIIKVKPEIRINELPQGDPEQSDGTYEKLKKILKINVDQFIKLDEGLCATIDYKSNKQKR